MNRVEQGGAGSMGSTRLVISKSAIAAIEGFAVAGGLGLALWCDLCVSASFGVLCRRWGVPLTDGGTVRLPHIVGQGYALDMILPWREVTAGEAQTMGLVNRIVPESEARHHAESLAAELSGSPQLCMHNDRRSFIDLFDGSCDAAMQREFALGVATTASGETSDGAGRFVDGQGRHGAF